MATTAEAPAIVGGTGADRAPVPGLTTRQIVWRTLAYVAGVAALAGFLVARIGRFGFNPSDQGFVLSLSWRVLDGQIPHLDVVSPRPLGSAYLHTLEFALPGPLFLASGFVTMVEIVVSTIACAALVSRVSPLRWGPLRILLVAAAAVINLHTFTMMAWHTIDGIFLTSVGWWLLDSGLRGDSPWRRRIGLFLLGFAVMCKQSFMFAVPVGVLLLLFHPAVDLRADVRSARWWRRTVVDLLCLGGFPLVYAAVVTAAGGLSPMIDQVTGGAGAWGQNLYDFWGNGDFVVGDVRRHIVMVAGCALVAVGLWLLRRPLGTAGPWVRVMPLAGAALVTVYALVQSSLTYPATWAIKLLWILLAVIVLDAVVHRHFPWRPLLIVLLAYMVSLSWGYNQPGLVAGTLVLTTLELLRQAAPEFSLRDRRWVIPQALLGIAALLGAGLLLVNEHDRAPAIDRPQGELTADLGDATPEMRGIRTTPNTARYVSQIGDCLEEYPASQVAVLPDNAFAYPAFAVRSPFPLDWPLPMELVADAPQRMLETVDRLNRDGDYLVLFETRNWQQLRAAEPVPTSVPVDTGHVSHSGLENQIRDGLTGQRISCGSFVGVYAPAD